MNKQKSKEKIILCCLSLCCTVISIIYAIMCAYLGFLRIAHIHILHVIAPALLLVSSIIPLVLNILGFLAHSNIKALTYNLAAILLCLFINLFRFFWSFTLYQFPVGSFIVLVLTVLLFIGFILLRSSFNKNSDYDEEISIPSKSDGYISLTKFVLLSLFTLGIWTCIWYYKTTKYLNAFCGKYEYRDPINKLLLCMFVPFYSIYWVYKSAKILDDYAELNIAKTCLTVDIFISIVAQVILQSNINDVSQANAINNV